MISFCIFYNLAQIQFFLCVEDFKIFNQLMLNFNPSKLHIIIL